MKPISITPAAMAKVKIHGLASSVGADPDRHVDLDLDLGLPLETGQATGRSPATLCLRPNEWLLLDESATDADQLLQKATPKVTKTADPTRIAIIDMTDGLSILRVDGAGAAWLLSKLSGLDFPGGFGSTQHCAQTRMGRISVLVHHHEPEPGKWIFDLIVDRSLEKYLHDLLNASIPHAVELANTFGDTF